MFRAMLVLAVLIVTPANAADAIRLHSIDVRMVDNTTEAIMFVENNTGRDLDTVYVTCDFFAEGVPVDRSLDAVYAISTGQSALAKMAIMGLAGEARCRVTGVK